MNIYGIICEYNPLHNGHEYHIARTRKLGADAIVCVMSGCFVQRAEPAIMSKFARAKCAIAAGADLVIELPSPWSTASAEAFARGAMSILGSLGCVTHCSFGCEAHDISTLCATADTLLNASFYEKVRDELSRGISFPAARARVMAREFPHLASVLDTPNNILAVEYIKAIYSQKLNIEPVAITRIGAAHDSEEAATFPSASALRTLINSGDIESALCAMPPSSAKIFRDEYAEGRAPVKMADAVIMSYLKRLSLDDFLASPDVSEGLETRLLRAVANTSTLSDAADCAKTKRYTHSRIRRALLTAFLGITRAEVSQNPSYARVLAFNNTGRDVLKVCKKSATIPIITKAADARATDIKNDLMREAARSSQYYILMPKPISGSPDITTSPIYFP